MNRFFIDPGAIEAGERAALTGGVFHHACRVLRLSAGAPVILADGSGMEHPGRIERVEKDRAWVRLEAPRPSAAEPAVQVSLVQALIKGERMDYCIQKGTELGVARFVPCQTERTVVRLSGEALESRRRRWERIALSAAEQSGRGRVPEIEPLQSWEEAVAEPVSEEALFLLPWEQSAEPLRPVLEEAARRGVRQVRIAIGPEGGLSGREVRRAEEAGARTVSLGPRLLRAETAGPVTAALVLFFLEGER